MKRKKIVVLINKTVEAKGIRKVDLARKMGIDKGSVSNWLNGKKNITFENLILIEKALDIELINVE